MGQLKLLEEKEGTQAALGHLAFLKDDLMPHYSSSENVKYLLLKEYHLAVQKIQVSVNVS